MLEKVTEYTINAHPDPESVNYHLYQVQVQFRQGYKHPMGVWVVHRCGLYLDYDDTWSPQWSVDRNGYSELVALGVAREWAPKLVANNMTALECWEWEQKRREVADADS